MRQLNKRNFRPGPHIYVLLATLLIIPGFTVPCAAEAENRQNRDSNPQVMGRMGQDMGNSATYISSDSLWLKANERLFSYHGNVTVTQGDMTLKSDILDGRYNEDNEIETLEARGNVTIAKGNEIEAQSNKANFDSKTQTLVLSENPQLKQNGGYLTADVIRIYLEEDRSVAEGEVRMRLDGQSEARVKVSRPAAESIADAGESIADAGQAEAPLQVDQVIE